MPLYDWLWDCGQIESIWAEIDNRDAIRPQHRCGKLMRRLPGGRGLLYFEDGRGRVDIGLGGKPVTSPKDRERRMRAAGLTDSGDYLPKAIRDNPKSEGMKRHLDKKQGRWV